MNIEEKIKLINKTQAIEHKVHVWSILELNDLRLATGDANGNLTVFSIDYENNEWTKIIEEKGHNGSILYLDELSGN